MRLASEVSAQAGARRDDGLTAVILGFFALAWFSWGQAAASGALSAVLTVGSAAALIVTVLGGIAMGRGRRTGGALQDRTTRRRYGSVVGIEFALAGLGAVALGATGVGAYIPAWVCAVVGLHFFALASVLGAPALRLLGAAVTTTAVAALVLGAFTDVAPSSVAGSGAGLALFTYAAVIVRWLEPTAGLWRPVP